MKISYRVLAFAAGFAVACVGSWSCARAQGEVPNPPILPPILVIGTSPVPGLNIDADKVPGNVQSLSAADLKQDGASSLINALSAHLGSVNINDTLADPFQPDILYRGFEASPVLGTPQGLAVYQNGVRINEAFGDTVDWDLFPDIAVNRIDIVSANPLYGLNALGGALAITMKNGFTFQGVDGELSGGSFNQRQGAAEFGYNEGVFGFYAAARGLNQDGWRLFSRDSVRQYYMDLSLHGDGTTVDLSYARANNRLYGQGEAPVQSLAVDIKNVFTNPQSNFNTLDFVVLNAARDLSSTLAMQTVLYSRKFRQAVGNGNGSNFVACAGAHIGSLCQGEDGTTPLAGASGALIPDISNGGATLIGQNDFETINSQGWGASVQLTSAAQLFGHGNDFAVGAAIDAAQTNFFSGTEVGVLDSALTVLPSGLFVDTPEGTDFSATPVNLNSNNKYYGFYATDTLDVTAKLSVTASVRYNIAKIDLSDLRGTALNGINRYTHVNPAVGATYKLSPSVTMFAGYSTNNRAPTASEIECSDPLRPCLLPSNMSGDPPTLRQVIAHTAELGLRGRVDDAGPGRLTWNASAFRTDSDDDIYGVATSISTGFFQNVGSTRREGFEAGLNYESERWSGYAQYSYVNATFRSPLTLNSSSNPHRDADGNIHVRPGDALPLIPKNRFKIGADVFVLPRWSVGASLMLVSDEIYKGDESNQNPPLPGFHPASLRSSYRVNERFQIFVNVQNLFDERYSTVGLFSDPTGVNAPGIPPDAASNDPRVDNRFQSPTMPRAYFGGVRFAF